jgi:hypothetical protein
VNQIIEANGSLMVTKTLIGQAEDLAAEHEAFNTNYVIGGRKALYSLLGKIAALVEQFDAAVDKDELLEIVRTQLQEQYGIRTQQNTSDITVLVRYITRADRKTAHVYARAIETARANQIAPAHFAGYLEQVGGVERIRANGVESADNSVLKPSLQEKLNLTRKYLNARREFPIATVSVNTKQAVNFGPASHLNVLVCSEREGRYYVLAKLSADETLEKKLVEALAQQLPDNLKQVDKNIDRFYDKAMKKRSQNTLKALIKLRPAVAAGMLRANRIRSLALAKSNTQSI